MDDIYAVARGEVLALHLADAVGIQACEARALNTAQKFPVALIKGFDRSSTGNRFPRIIAQTFMGLAGPDRPPISILRTGLRLLAAKAIKSIGRAEGTRVVCNKSIDRIDEPGL